MKPIRFLFLTGLLASLLAQSGCNTILPKTADLQHVHELYADEFMTQGTPSPGAPNLTPPVSGAAFAQSLRAIHEYRIKYPDDKQQLAHLDVLEGMIYLQSGRFGLATAMKAKVTAADDALKSAKGTIVRDRIFAQNFDALLDGWAETQKANNRDWRTFERVADALAKSVNDIPPDQRADVETDQGALYVATSAAVFYVWAYRQFSLSNDDTLTPAKKLVWFGKGRDLIGPFLTAAEKQSGANKELGATEQGRLRYVLWYHWLDQQATLAP